MTVKEEMKVKTDIQIAQEAKMLPIKAVSYTHLDVYKRQE